MIKRIASVIAGIISGVIVVMIGDMITGMLFPVPPNIDFNNKEQVQKIMSEIPSLAMAMMLLFWLLSSLTGGFVTAKIIKERWKIPVIITGTILMLAAVMNMVMLPHPLWMMIGAILLYIPSAYLGGKLATKNA